MRKSDPPIKIIVALTQHPALGNLLMPYVAEDMDDGTVRLTEYGGRLPAPVVAKLGEVERKMLDIASKYTERYLMRAFTKAPALPVFYRKLEDEKTKKTIRAFIDKKLIEMLELIRAEQIPLYKNDKGNKILYDHSMIEVSPYYTNAHFDFATDNEHFHYSLHCKRNGEEISLLEKKPVTVLTSSPASIILHNELHLFQDISTMRILPFTHKARVSVNVSETDKYLEKIVLPVLEFHDTTFSSLPIFEEKKPFKAALTVEEDADHTTMLKLSYQYEDDTFYPGPPLQKKSARIQKDEEGKVSIYYYHKDTAQEQALVQLLEEAHLTLVDDRHFKLSDDAPEMDMAEWIKTHREMLSEKFQFIS